MKLDPDKDLRDLLVVTHTGDNQLSIPVLGAVSVTTLYAPWEWDFSNFWIFCRNILWDLILLLSLALIL